jgi:hypothetical protein
MKTRIKNILIILLKVDYWTYFLTGLSILLFFIFLDDNQVLMTSLILNVVFLRIILVYFLKSRRSSKTLI